MKRDHAQSEQAIVVLFSGGLDSTTVLALSKKVFRKVWALTVSYGQSHAEELVASRKIARALEVEQIEVALDLRGLRSALLGHGAVPLGGSAVGEIPSTYVPGRNLIFSALALAHAESLGARYVGLGVNAIDFSGYPDCRGEFITKLEEVARVGTKCGVEGNPVHFFTPLVESSKADIVRLAHSLGLFPDILSLTHSCYAPAEAKRCGRCDACLLRAAGFASAGFADPSP